MTSLVRSDYFYETRRWILPDKVVASRITMGSLDPDLHLDGFKPYVYRGNGLDTLTPDFDDTRDEHGRPRRESKPARATRLAYERGQHQARARGWLAVLRQEQARQRRAMARKQDAANRRRQRIQRRVSEYEHYTKPAPVIEPVKHSHPSPSPGWQPLKGSDIEDMLADLDVE